MPATPTMSSVNRGGGLPLFCLSIHGRYSKNFLNDYLFVEWCAQPIVSSIYIVDTCIGKFGKKTWKLKIVKLGSNISPVCYLRVWVPVPQMPDYQSCLGPIMHSLELLCFGCNSDESLFLSAIKCRNSFLFQLYKVDLEKRIKIIFHSKSTLACTITKHLIMSKITPT